MREQTIATAVERFTRVQADVQKWAIHAGEYQRAAEELVARWSENIREVQLELVPRGWLISPDLPATFWQKLHAERQQGSVDSVERLLVRSVDGAVDSLFEGMYEHREFAHRRTLLDSAREAHKRRGVYSFNPGVSSTG